MLGKSKFLLLSACLWIYPEAWAALPVKVENLTSEPLISELQIHGTVNGKNDVELAAGTAGLLEMVMPPGSYIKQGELIAKIDTIPLELEKAQYQETLNRAKINLHFYEQELTRLTSLAKTNSAAVSQVDSMRNQRDLAKSDIAMAEIRLRQVEDKINRASLRAPFDGVVSERMKMAHSEVNRADELVKFIDINNLEVRVFVPVKYIDAVSLQQVLKIHSSSSFNTARAEAQVDAIIPATDTRSQTFEIRATLESQASGKWASGQLVDVTVPLLNQKNVLLVDRDALILRQGGVHIVKINDDNTAKRVTVTVGKGQGNRVEITPADTSLLKVGDKIAVRGAERLNDGQAVEIQ